MVKCFGLVLCDKDTGLARYWIASYKTEKGAIDAFVSLRKHWDGKPPNGVHGDRCIVKSHGHDSIIEF